MDELLPRFRKAGIFTKLDLNNVFYVIDISPSSRHITTFISSKRLLEYKPLMFGIICATEIFQITIERTLSKYEGTINLIDDILV